MLRIIVILYISNLLAADTTYDTSTYNHVGKNVKTSRGALGFYASLSNNPIPLNISYYEKEENQVRIPTKIYEDQKKRTKIKKLPKRTIQKIIKKGKNKSRKIYVNPVTRHPMTSSIKVEMIDSAYTQDEDITTGSPRRRPRKNSKIARYPMPFHKLQSRKDSMPYHRNKRELERDDVFILKDLDEVEFLDRGPDYDVVKAHVKKYW